MSHLKCRPVHMHPGPVVVAEPLQVLLCVCSQNRALQFSVYCGIAEEREGKKSETNSDQDSASRDSGFDANLATKPQRSECGSRLIQQRVMTRLQNLSELSAEAEACGINNPNNTLHSTLQVFPSCSPSNSVTKKTFN